MPTDVLLKLIAQYGAGSLLIVVICVWSGWLYLKREYDALQEERDYYRDLARTGTNTAEHAVGLAEKAGELRRHQHQSDGEG